MSQMPTQSATQEACPYKGLVPYTDHDADIFCGRTKWIQAIYDDLQQKSFVALTGASGSGKTSLIFGGLIPKLRKETIWQIVNLRTKESPFYELSKALIPFLAHDLNPFDQAKETKQLADGFRTKNVSLFDVTKEIIEKCAPNTRLLLIIDQFEELYALCPLTEEKDLFLELILNAVHLSKEFGNPIFQVLISLRADFLGQIISHRRMSGYLSNADHKLGPMSSDELREAIELPAQKRNTVLEPGLSDYILKTCIPTNIPLPLISFSLKCLWDKEHESALTIRGFEEMGATELSLANYAEAIYEGLTKKDKIRSREIFIRLVCPGEGTEDVRCMINRNEMISRNWPLISLFVEKGLLIAERNQNNEIQHIEVVHDILFKEWGRLHGWIQDNRDFRLWRKRLQSKLWYWEKNGQKSEDLLSNELLVDSLQWLEDCSEQIEFSEKRYIQNSAAKNKPGATKKRFAFILRCILVFVFIAGMMFASLYMLDMKRSIHQLAAQKAHVTQTLKETQEILSHTKQSLTVLQKKYHESEQKWQEALNKSASATQQIESANQKMQQAQDIQWRAERQMQFAEKKRKESETLLAKAKSKLAVLKEQTHEFEQHYQEQVSAIKVQTLELEAQSKQAEIKMAAAEQLALDAQAQLQLVSEKKAQFETTIQEMKEKQAILTEAACSLALTYLTLDQWRALIDQSPLKNICE
jgi:energy-coupling factor transporter ATP-binding protein EcfA2